MNRKLILLSIFFIITVAFSYGQETEKHTFKEYSSKEAGDSDHDYKGVALAFFVREDRIPLVIEQFDSMGKKKKKLSNRDNWLCWQALNELDLQDQESYIIILGKTIEDEKKTVVLIQYNAYNDGSFTSTSWLVKL